MNFIEAKNLVHEYIRRDDDGNVESIYRALGGVDLDAKAGEFIAILGHNGSGKSTFAKHLNVLLTPTEGSLWVDGKDASEDKNLWDIRKTAGMVFQNPDNQIIAGIVEEDVGFGPENLGIPTDEIWKRVETSLKSVGMLEYRRHSPNRLSGGQKQRVAIAGVMAMEPKCIVLDEPTAMLDPLGRKEVLDAVEELNRDKGITIILITHYMDEVVRADRVYVMDEGKIVMEGTPREIFSRVDALKKYRLDVPQITLLAHELRKAGLPLPEGILTRQELEEALCRHLFKIRPPSGYRAARANPVRREMKPDVPRAYLILDKINYVYGAKTAYEQQALKEISLKIEENQFIGIIGHTGSGKSTLIQHLNGLLKATSGRIYYNGEDIYDKGYDLKGLRSKVGLVFQYPEHQLFETTVFKDVSFGPKNQGLSPKEAGLKAFEALHNVDFPEDLWYQSPFDLSGGQKRRAAIAGVLAMKPEVLILDEPTAGLDPKGREEILGQIAKMHRELHMTIILVSHSMEDVADYVDRLIVMNHGELFLDGTPGEVFSHYKELEAIGLAAPQVTYLMHELRERGLPVRTDATTLEEAKAELLSMFGDH